MESYELIECFEKIKEVTNVIDIGYHEIRFGKLNPVYKTQTSKLSVTEWKEVHSNNVVYVDEHIILKELRDKGEIIAIEDVDKDPRSSNEFFLFGIQSIMLIPVKKNHKVIGLIVVASIGEKHQFTKNEIEGCRKIIEEL